MKTKPLPTAMKTTYATLDDQLSNLERDLTGLPNDDLRRVPLEAEFRRVKREINATEMKTTVKKLADQIAADPSASFFLKDAVKKSLQRDPLDALRDAEALVAILADNADVENDANAVLLAAAPFMLVSLKAIVAALDQPVQHTGSTTPAAALILRGDAATALGMARNAISKATNPNS